MSAIFGVLASSPSSSVKRTVSTLQSTYTKRYAFDRSRTKVGETWGMGALEQWINVEEERTPQPYRLDSCVIVADVMLDYREALQNQLDLSLSSFYTDVELIAHAYQKWGIKCVHHLHGIFAFAIYDEETEELWIVRDRLGERAICYAEHNDSFAFSTTPKPLAKLYKSELNETFMKQTAIAPLELKNQEAYATPWSGIHYVPPGHRLRYHRGDIKLEEYWSYERPPERVFASEEACHRELNHILEEATKMCMRTDGEVGLMLSGGLDSTTVAAVAAPLLKKEQKPLHAYTHVPLAEYEDSEQIMGNERPLVEDVLDYYPSIQPNWIENRERNSFNTIEDWLDILEMPYVFTGNAPWLLSIYERASASGVKVLLNGKHGNFTVSYGAIATYYNELVKSFQLSKIKQELGVLVRENGSLLQACKPFLVPVLGPLLKKSSPEAYFRGYSERLFTQDIQNELNYRRFQPHPPNVKQRYDELYALDDLHIRGVLSTMCSLHFGFVIRDPLSNLNLITFCASLPSEYFASGGISKRLVRLAMRDKLPPSVLNPKRARGLQSADWALRLKDEQEAVLAALNSALPTQTYFQTNALSKLSWEDLTSDMWTNSFVFRMIVIETFKGGE